MEVAIDAAPGEIVEKLPKFVEAVLRLDPTATDDFVKAVRGHLENPHEESSERWWRWPAGAALAASGLQPVLRRYGRIVDRVQDEVWPLTPTQIGALAKAGGYLTPAQLEHLRAVVLDEHLALAVELYGPEVLPPEVLDRLLIEGVLTDVEVAEARRLGLLGGAYHLGAATADDEASGKLTAEEARDLAEALAAEWDEDEPGGQPADGASGRPPPPPPDDDAADGASGRPPPPDQPPPGESGGAGESSRPLTRRQRAARAARLRAGQQIVGLGNRVAADLTTIAVDSENEDAQRRRRAIAEAVASGIEQDASTRDIRTAVVEALDGDYSRDLDRIVATEVHAAMQTGYRDELLEQHGPDGTCTIVPSPGACRHCVRLFTEGGTPRVFRLADLPLPSVNFRKKAAERVACVPPLHPWCGCHLKWVPKGWAVAGDGTVVPPQLLNKSLEPARAKIRWTWGRHIGDER